MHTDNESAIIRIAEYVQKNIGSHKLQLRQSPRYSSASLAHGESINSVFAGKIRTWLYELSHYYGREFDAGHPIFPWLVKHVSWLLGRFHKVQGMTPFRIVRGYDYLGEVCSFGETLMAKWPDTGKLSKTASRWIKGIYVGKVDVSDEHILLTEAGAQTFRTVRRLPDGSQYQKWAIENCCCGFPWDPDANIKRAVPSAETSPEPIPRRAYGLTWEEQKEAEDSLFGQQDTGIDSQGVD